MSPAAVEQRFVDNMATIYAEAIPFHRGAREAVAFAAASYPTALASGSPRRLIDILIKDPALHGKFQATLTGDQFPEGKPHPAIYLAAAAELGFAPENCVCLEDSGNGILAGKQAGMKVIAVPDDRFKPAADILDRADVVLNSLEELQSDIFRQLG